MNTTENLTPYCITGGAPLHDGLACEPERWGAIDAPEFLAFGSTVYPAWGCLSVGDFRELN